MRDRLRENVPRLPFRAAALLAVASCSLTGCKTVWPVKMGGATAVGATAATTPRPPVTTPGDHAGPFESLTEQQALQRVLPKLQHIAQADPETHAKLLEQLAAAEPSLWPDTVERAESTLRYRQQLAQKSQGRSDIRVASNESPLTYDRPTYDTPKRTPPPQHADVITPVEPIRSAAPDAYPVTTPPHQHSSAHPMNRTPQIRQVSATTVADDRGPRVIQNQHFDESPATAHDAIRVASVAAADQLRRPVSTTASHGARPGDWHDSLHDAIATLNQSAAATPQTRREAYELVRLRLLQLAAGDSSAAVAATPGLSSTEQSYWSKQLYAMSVLLDAENTPDRRKRAAQAAPHQAEALALVRELGPLQVRNAAFCKQVYGYGAYEPIDSTEFDAGQHVKLYAEVDNYRSDSTENGYHTLLATSYRVLDKHGGLVDSGEFPTVEDNCLTRRRDFHITYGVTLPTAIYAGDYDLEITITDQLGDKIGSETVPFSIAKR